MGALRAYCALSSQDENCLDYVTWSQAHPLAMQPAAVAGAPGPVNSEKEQAGSSPLKDAVMRGLVREAGNLAKQELQTQEPMTLVQAEIIPALDAVGAGFERGSVFLPQLMMAAEAAGAAFEAVKAAMAGQKENATARCPFVLATVRGDIHDIGKNIVRLLLENYGFDVVDLGKDVPPETIVQAVTEKHAPLCGLSALMTTTVPAMRETIGLLRKDAPWCQVVVGGAVLTEEYAREIGADAYAKDAMATVRYAEQVDDELRK